LKYFFIHDLLLFHINLNFTDLPIGYTNIDSLNFCNIIGNINVTSSALRHMRSGGGTIILLSSVLAMKPEFGTSIYAGCKGFIESYIKTVAHENMGKVSVVGIELGYFDGGLTHRISSDIIFFF
jgi:NAD(P)-dependent dehydrogenase (short-subunit alcohol dehydrogenase family)